MHATHGARICQLLGVQNDAPPRSTPGCMIFEAVVFRYPAHHANVLADKIRALHEVICNKSTPALDPSMISVEIPNRLWIEEANSCRKMRSSPNSCTSWRGVLRDTSRRARR